MKFLYIICAVTFVQLIVSNEIFDINLPLNHLSQYFNSLSRFAKLKEASADVYKEFLKSDKYDKEKCWGYEYGCKKPAHTHQCPGNHSGYVKSKEAHLDVFYSQADFGRNFKFTYLI